MFLEEKIEKIRQKPETVRIRYVVGSVATVMAVLIVFWIAMLRVGFRSSGSSGIDTVKDAVPSSMKGLVDDGASVKESVDSMRGFLEEGFGSVPSEEIGR